MPLRPFFVEYSSKKTTTSTSTVQLFCSAEAIHYFLYWSVYVLAAEKTPYGKQHTPRTKPAPRTAPPSRSILAKAFVRGSTFRATARALRRIFFNPKNASESTSGTTAINITRSSISQLDDGRVLAPAMFNLEIGQQRHPLERQTSPSQ